MSEANAFRTGDKGLWTGILFRYTKTELSFSFLIQYYVNVSISSSH